MKAMKVNLAAFAAISLMATAAATASGYNYVAPDSDIRMCVTAIGEQVGYDDADRVRHDVVTSKRRTVGYLLEIETTVFEAGSGDIVGEYETECTATGGQSPSRLRVTEKGV